MSWATDWRGKAHLSRSGGDVPSRWPNTDCLCTQWLPQRANRALNLAPRWVGSILSGGRHHYASYEATASSARSSAKPEVSVQSARL